MPAGPDAAAKYLPRAEQDELQARLLQRQLTYVLERSPHYRRRWPDLKPPATPAAALALLRDLPPTTRADLAADDGGFQCCPPGDVRDVVCTSGTTGRPIAIPLAAADLDLLARTEADAFCTAGVTAADTALLCVTLNALFMAGLAYYLGLQRIGCRVLRQGPGSPDWQLGLVRRFGVTMVMTTPSFLLALLRAARAAGLTPREVPLRRAVLVGETLRTRDLQPNAMARAILGLWDLEIYGSYGNTEMCGSMVECAAGSGHHVHPELVLPEILREDGTPAAPGEPGALVVTPLQPRGAPLLRYRTGDISFLIEDPCACGRTSRRVGPILAREDQMLKIRGTKVYPAAARDLALAHDFVIDALLVARTDAHGSDALEVLVAVAPGATARAAGLADRLTDALRVRPEVRVVPEAELAALAAPAHYRKKRWFVDQRQPPDGSA